MLDQRARPEPLVRRDATGVEVQEQRAGRAEPANEPSSDHRTTPVRHGRAVESGRLGAVEPTVPSATSSPALADIDVPARSRSRPERPSSLEDDDALLVRLVDLVGPAGRRWLEDASVVRRDGVLVLTVTNTFGADFLRSRHATALRTLASEEEPLGPVGPRGPAGADAAPSTPCWRIEVDTSRRAPVSTPTTIAAEPPTQRPRRHGAFALPTHRQLEDFVVGESNRTAYQAARALAESPTPSSLGNLFLHGECGVGKTHLIVGLCAMRRRLWPDERIWYTTGEQFTNEFLHHLRHNTLDQFRARVRRADLLAIDDVHFLADKTRTTSELLHTLDAVSLDRTPVVMASDGHPGQIRSFSRALCSRLTAGMVVRIDLPDHALRVELVERMAAQRAMRLSAGAIQTLGTRCAGSARELEGALNMLNAMRAVDQPADDVGQVLVDQMLQMRDDTVTGPVRHTTVLLAVCERLCIPRSDPLGSGRHPRVVLARAVYTRLCRELTSMSFPEIARSLNRRAHSTVHAAEQRMSAMLQAEAVVTELGDDDRLPLAELLEQIRRLIRRAGG